MNAQVAVTMEEAWQTPLPRKGLTKRRRRSGFGGALAQEFIDLAAALNAARVALPFAALRDF